MSGNLLSCQLQIELEQIVVLISETYGNILRSGNILKSVTQKTSKTTGNHMQEIKIIWTGCKSFSA